MPMVSQTLRISVLRLAVGLAFLLSFAAVSRADDVADKAALDGLFAELRVAKDAQEAHTIDQKIWMAWIMPTDPILAIRN